MKKDQLFLSTIAPDAAEEARRHGLGAGNRGILHRVEYG